MTFGTMSDSELVALGSSGSRGAFDELDARHREHVYAQCLGIMRDHELALDCVQDTLVKAYLALPGFRRDARFSTWLYVIARNVCLMRLRKKTPAVVSLDCPVEFAGGPAEREFADPLADASAGVMREELSDVDRPADPGVEPAGKVRPRTAAAARSVYKEHRGRAGSVRGCGEIEVAQSA